MPLSGGTHLGAYEVLGLIGAGGMGEVYRGRDTKLKRDVALKVLPDAFARDPGRMARFQREAEVLASLNHPNIAHIYGVEERALVMELVEGESPKGPLPFEEGWKIALQIADALEYAHDHGVIHRDLKPANVRVTPDGVVKLLDFGLAKAFSQTPEYATADPENSPTLTLGATVAGTVLGTAAYMSPEQAKGKRVDKRADIWSWGVVLYELLTGERLFKGEDTADTLAQVLAKEPDLSKVPARVQRLIGRCLEKDPKLRLRDIGEARYLLEQSLPERQTATTKWVWWPIAAAGAGVLVLAVGFWRLATEPQAADMSRHRLRPFATEDYAETSPVWSPDGKSIAYLASGVQVKSLDGSPPVALGVRGGQLSWSPDESRLYYIRYSRPTGGLFGPVFSVSRAGGEPAQVTQQEVFAAAISPDGHTLAALLKEDSGGQQQRVLTLSSPPGSAGKRFKAFPGWAAQNRLAWSPDGNKILLWFQAPSSLWLANVRSGDVKQIASPPRAISIGFSWFPDNRRVAISWPRGDTSEGRADLSILDTGTGNTSLLMPSAENVTDPSVSPDGKAIAFQSGVRDFSLMELPLDGSPPRPLLVTSQWEDSAEWSPVAPEYVYVSHDAIWLRRRDSVTRDSGPRLVVNSSAFSGGEEAFRFSSPSFSPDGARVAYTTGVYRSDTRRGWISATSGGTPAPLGQFGGNVVGLTWSPDGHWIAFTWQPSPASGSRLAKIRVGSSAEPVPLADEGCSFSPAWSPDNSRILCSAGGVLYTISADGGQRQFLSQEYEPIAAWSREMRYIYVIRSANSKRQLGKLDWKSGVFQPLTDVPVEWTINTPSLSGARLSLSPDGKSLAVTVARTTGDIWILEGFQPPPTLWQRLLRR